MPKFTEIAIDRPVGVTTYAMALAMTGRFSRPLVLDPDVPRGRVDVSSLCVSIHPSMRPAGRCPKPAK